MAFPAFEECRFEVTVRKTFLHFALQSDTVDDGCDDRKDVQPDVGRAVTAPECLRRSSMDSASTAEVDEELDYLGSEVDEDEDQPSIERIVTLDPMDEAAVDADVDPTVGATLSTVWEHGSSAGSESSSVDSLPSLVPHAESHSQQGQQQRRQVQLQLQEALPAVQSSNTNVAPLMLSQNTSAGSPALLVPVNFVTTALQQQAVLQQQTAMQLQTALATVQALSSSMLTMSGFGGHGVVPTPAQGAVVSGTPSKSSEEAKPAPAASRPKPARKAGQKVEPNARTTVMLRNLPPSMTRATLLSVMDAEGFAGTYNFLYLPIEFRTHEAAGYAFVNFDESIAAQRFLKHFDGFVRWPLAAARPCSVAWSDPHQGLESNIARYRNSPLMHALVPDSYRPALFRDGVRVPFPEPTKKIKAPRQGTERMLV